MCQVLFLAPFFRWKNVYSDRHTLHRQECGHPSQKSRGTRVWGYQFLLGQGMGLSVFIGVGNFIHQWMGGLSQLFWVRGMDFQKLGPPTFWPFMVHLGTTMAPMGVSFIQYVKMSTYWGLRSNESQLVHHLGPRWFSCTLYISTPSVNDEEFNSKKTSPGSMHNTGCLGLVHWDNPEGWYGEGGGFRMGNTCIPVVDSVWYLAKLIQLCKV